MKNSYYNELMNYMENRPAISTHCHHQRRYDRGVTLRVLLSESYVGWIKAPYPTKKEERKAYLDKVRFNSYFKYLEKGIMKLYGITEHLNEDTWDMYESIIKDNSKGMDDDIRILKEVCNYKAIVQDQYWEPGGNSGLPELFTPTFRINSFLYAYNETILDHDNKNARQEFDFHPNTIEEFVEFMDKKILSMKEKGCVALKCANAYDRDINFKITSIEKARLAFNKDESHTNEVEIRYFQDYIFYEVCKIAAKYDLPIQMHTGLGLLDNSNAMNLYEAIHNNPETRFVLFHGSYPDVQDICGLAHNYLNVYPDLCWLPIISPSACHRLLNELIEVGDVNKITWGCDTWTSQESYGALIAIKEVLSKVLSNKVEDRYLDMNDAKLLCDKILFENAKSIYKLNV